MNELIRAFQCINVFDPELEYDYEPLKTVLKQEWHDEASKPLWTSCLGLAKSMMPSFALCLRSRIRRVYLPMSKMIG